MDRLFGGSAAAAEPAGAATRTAVSVDERALSRYRYVIRTAPPETIEQVHVHAFARLTDGQRALIYEELARGAATGERPLSSEPATLARAAARAELRHPGSIERALSGSTAGITPGAPGFGSMLASSMLGTVAGYVVGSALVSAFLPWEGGYVETASDAGAGDASTDSGFGTTDADFGGDFGF